MVLQTADQWTQVVHVENKEAAEASEKSKFFHKIWSV